MNLNNINTIARYEVKLLKRSWLFRIFAILALLGISAFVILTQTDMVITYQMVWPKIAIPSFMPFTSIYYYSIAQSVIVIFLAGSFLQRDKKLDTAEVIYVRPMSNADYIIGKTWGIVKVFISLNIIALLITAFLNILINKSPFSVYPYLVYLLTISLPSLLFILGLSFTATCLLKNQAVTFIIMLGIIGTVFFYLTDTLYGVFDFFGVNIPVVFSDVTGHADIRLFLLQRGVYLLAGIGLISFTIALAKRLPHKPWKVIIVNTIGAVSVGVACIGGLLYVLHYQHQLTLRSEYATTFNEYRTARKGYILEHDITVTPNGKQLVAESVMKVVNKQSEKLDKLIFYLNPSLEVVSLEANGIALPFTRENQVVSVGKTLASNEELILTMCYQGGINEAICYTDILEKDYIDTKNPMDAPYRLGKRYAWLEKDFTLLTPECLWYPVTEPPVNPEVPYAIQKNFTGYTLSVVYPGKEIILSQGESKKEGDTTTFTNLLPLPGISLTIADYEKKSLQTDSVSYEIYHFRGHDYFSGHFDVLGDTLPGVIRELKNDIELSMRRDYPFRKFVLAETPVQFAAYVRNWKGYTEYIQPEIIFIPERGSCFDSDFKADKKRSRDWGRGDQGEPDETEMAINILRNFLQETFINEKTLNGWRNENSRVNPFYIAPLLFGHTNFVSSPEFPVIDIVLNIMQSTAHSQQEVRFWEGIINDKQRANLYLETHSFETAIADTSIKPEIFHELLKLKGTALNNYITSRVSAENFTDFLKEFFTQRRFAVIPFDSLNNRLQERFGLDLTDFIHSWYSVDHSPALLIKAVDANQVVIDEFTKYQVKFKVNNPSNVEAILTAQIQQGDGGNRRRRGKGNITFGEAQNYIIPAHTAQEIKIITDERPANLTINTNISHNLPTLYTFNFAKIDNTTNDTLSGMSPTDPEAFRPNPNEIIVDNESNGFRTIASNSRHKLKDFFRKKEEEKYKNFRHWRIPSQWTSIATEYCYGETVNSAVYKNKGSGTNAAEWKAEIPHDGYYEVAIWNPKMGRNSFRMRRNGGKEEHNQTYILQSQQEKETIILNLEEEDEGWISVGNFYLPKGATTITLTDKVSGDYVIADAVKFTFTD